MENSIMKKNYIMPSIESVAFYAGTICNASAGAGTDTMTVGGGVLGGGGESGGEIIPQ